MEVAGHDVSPKRLLSLFDLSGNWSDPYRVAGWEVLQIDKESGQDILDWDYQQFPRDYFNGILAAVPCTAYTKAGNLFWKKKDADGTTDYFNLLTAKTLEIIDYFRPGLDFWTIENPAGRLDSLFPQLRPFRLLAFQPWHYGDGYTKYTILWGEFNPFLVRRPAPYVRRNNSRHSIDAFFDMSGPYADRAHLRSQTPHGFSKAFFEANH